MLIAFWRFEVEKDVECIQIDLDYLSGLVRAASQNPRIVVNDWQAQRLHGGFQLNSSIYRLQGHALDAENIMRWSLVLKIIRPDLNYPTPTEYRYWKREALAYQSGMLNTLTGAVVAPQCYDICVQPDGSFWLFLEDIHDESGSPWTLEEYTSAARCLGEFNGAFLAGHPVPDAEWIARGWLRNYLEHAALAVDYIRKNRLDTLIQGIFPGNTLAQILAFWDMHHRFLQKIESLPQTFCHQDAFDRNLFLRGGQAVAIDWGYTGLAPIGAELAPLIAAAIGIDGFPSERARELDVACFNAYLQGLQQAGYKPVAKQVRLGFLLTIALRYLLGNAVGETIPSLLDQERRKRLFENAPIPDIDNVKSDPGNVVYYQGIVFELLKQLGPVLTLEVLGRTLSYMVRFRSK